MKTILINISLLLILSFMPDVSIAVVKPVTPDQTQFLQSKFGVSSVDKFLQVNPKNIQTKTGKKLKLRDKIVLKLVQRKIRKQLKKGQTANVQTTYTETDKKFHFGGFLLGLTLGIIGIFIAAIFLKNAEESSLIGFLCWTILFLILVAYLLGAGEQIA